MKFCYTFRLVKYLDTYYLNWQSNNYKIKPVVIIRSTHTLALDPLLLNYYVFPIDIDIRNKYMSMSILYLQVFSYKINPFAKSQSITNDEYTLLWILYSFCCCPLPILWCWSLHQSCLFHKCLSDEFIQFVNINTAWSCPHRRHK